MTRNSRDTGSQTLGRGMTFLAWGLVLGLLTYLFDGFLQDRANPNREVKSAISADGVAEVKLRRNRAGHYVATGGINGREVVFLVDTGATDVAVSGKLAQRLGLDKGRPIASRTANGMALAYATRLDTVELGQIRQHDVRATILPNMGGDDVLLGMSFLKRLELIQRGGELTIRHYSPRSRQ